MAKSSGEMGLCHLLKHCCEGVDVSCLAACLSSSCIQDVAPMKNKNQDMSFTAPLLTSFLERKRKPDGVFKRTKPLGIDLGIVVLCMMVLRSVVWDVTYLLWVERHRGVQNLTKLRECRSQV